MSKILIVKTGTTFPSLKSIQGDFDEWVVRGLGRNVNFETQVVDVSSGCLLPLASDYAGVIVTGSHDMVTDHADWSERTAEWLWKTVKMEIPTVGICFGHQLLAYALGGKVGNNPNGWEFGTVVVTPNATGAQDELIGDFDGPFKAHMFHRQSVLELPNGAVTLAVTRKDACAAFSVNRCAWGLQFHPEFDSRIEKVYVLHHKDELVQQGANLQDVFSSCMETGCGHTIFQRFLKVVTDRERPAVTRSLSHAV